jgi:hypothetical protein
MPRPPKQVYIANESFVAKIDGIEKAYHQNRTRVREGDKVLELYPHLFDEDHGDFESYQ